FDVETLSPTYHLTIGLPGQSNALAIARRLGLDSDVLARAEAQLRPEHFEMERMLEEIRQERSAAADERHRERVAREEAEEIRRALAMRRDRIEDERASVLDDARRDAERELASIKNEIESLRRKRDRSGYDPQAADSTLRSLDSSI